jgi:hypothetical protein
MVPPNPIINGHVYNWYECVFKFDALSINGVLSVSGIKTKIEQAPQYGTGREMIDIATGKVEHDPITVAMYAFEWQRVKTMLTAKSLGRGYGLAKFAFTAMATGNPLEGAPPIGDVWMNCKISEVGKEYGQDANGFKIDITFQPMRHLDTEGQTMVNF